MNDTLIVAEATTVNEVQARANATLNIISKHIRNLDFYLAIDKTQAVVFTKRCGLTTSLIILEGEAVWLGSSLSYLSITLENKRTMFGAHLRATSAKAHRVMSVLYRLMIDHS